jgi:hypothetical protein
MCFCVKLFAAVGGKGKRNNEGPGRHIESYHTSQHKILFRNHAQIGVLNTLQNRSSRVKARIKMYNLEVQVQGSYEKELKQAKLGL